MNCILGTLNFDYKYVSELFDNQKICDFLEICLKNGINEIDTAFYYNNVEKKLGDTGMMDLFKISSKANPWLNNDFTLNKFGQLSKDNVRRQLETSLKNLNIRKMDIYYLHCWDYDTDLLETLKIFDDLYNEGKFDKFGVSNISLDQLKTILKLCKKHDLILPSVYQGMYNIYCRKIEEIFPTLKENNISFIAYNPLAGGLLTGKYSESAKNSFSRFNNNEIYKKIFLENKNIIKEIENSGLTAEMSLAWLKNRVDKIIIGASKKDQLISNIMFVKSSELSNIDNNTIDDFYDKMKDFQPNYFY